jgi:hypothetical protein
LFLWCVSEIGPSEFFLACREAAIGVSCFFSLPYIGTFRGGPTLDTSEIIGSGSILDRYLVASFITEADLLI